MSSGMRRLVLMVGAAVLTMRGAVAQAGPAYPLGRKAVCAGAAVEVELQVPKARGGSAPNRARVRAAVLRYAHWRDRRDDPAVLAEAEKTLATTANQSIASLAWTFLCSSGHGDATARAAKLAPPSSPAATMTKDHDVCQPKLECR